MSYLVCHIQKFKNSDVKGLQIHNQRESDKSKNTDIDKSKSHLNIDLHNDMSINYNKQVKEIIKQGYKGSKAIRKDAVVMASTLVTSDNKFFSEMPLDKQLEFFKQSYEYFKDRYGSENIVSAVVHLDEKTPHMHLCSVPITEDGKLSAKKILDRNSLREIQDELPKHLKACGFEIERGVEGSDKKHIEINKFKADTLKKEVQQLSRKTNILKNDLEARREVLTVFDKLDSVKPSKTLTGDLKLSKSDFELINNIAKEGEIARLAYNNLDRQNKKLADEIKKLKEENKRLSEKDKSHNNDFEKQKENYEKKLELLRGENTRIKNLVNSKIRTLTKDVTRLTSKLNKCNKFIEKEKLLPKFMKYIDRSNGLER